MAARFTTEGSDLPRFGPSGGNTHLVRDGDQTWLILSQGGRGGYQEWAFDLTDLCAGSPTQTGSPELSGRRAPSATSVRSL